MVIVTHPAEDRDGNATSQNRERTLKRMMRVEGDSLSEIMESTKIPQVNSRLPGNSMYWLKDISYSVVGNLGRRVQCNVELSYSNSIPTFSGGSSRGSDDKEDKPPWKLGAQNLSVTHASEQAPVMYGYDAGGNRVSLVNTASCPLTITGAQYIKQFSFTYCVREKASHNLVAPVNSEPTINRDYVLVAGISIPAYCGMLLPMTADLVVERDSEGAELRRYWQIKATIIYNHRGHVKRALNVGTLAMFKDKNGDIPKIPRPVYQFTPWKSVEVEHQITTSPVWGSIDDLMRAQRDWEDIYFNANPTQASAPKIPYNQVTEPVPLDNDGCVDQKALIDPKYNPVKKLEWFEYAPSSWRKWNLPKEAL